MPKANSTVAVLHAPDAKRRDYAMTHVTHQLEAIFCMLVVIVRQERDSTGDETVTKVPEWPYFDSNMLPEITRALAIRGRDLNNAMMNALINQITIDDLERVVFNG